ncbi:hypothetical protein JTB14_025043 [Gonioctena quinquepunctata]|nr:hypothetical protein JTB14_025043 [Gonioctena quinquepunctata]
MGEVIDLTDVTKICRICLERNHNLSSLDTNIEFEERELAPIKIIDALVSLTLVSIDTGQNLPAQICAGCKQLIKSALLFKFKFERSISILKIFTSGILTTNVQRHLIKDEQTCLYPNALEDDIDENRDFSRSPSYDIKSEDEEITETKEFSGSLDENKKPIIHPCPICSIELPALDLRSHIQTHQALRKYLSVRKVSPKAKFHTTSRRVRSVLEKNRNHKCPLCNENVRAPDFQTHVDSHHRHDNEFPCDKCGRTFRKINYLNIHRISHMKEYPFRCEECNKGFVLKKNYNYHVLMHKNILPYECEFCNKKYSNPEHLNRHRTLHTENMSYAKKYKAKTCKKCLNSFRDNELYYNHKCKPVPNRVPCKYCRKVFKTSRLMILHVRRAHKKEGLCSICGLNSKNIASHMQYHERRKLPNHKGLCSICGSYVTNIYDHMKKHKNIRPYKCIHCSKVFNSCQKLKKHELIHTGEKPFACGSCDKSFNKQYNLQVHERIHSGNKCHICKVCNKGFLEKSYLRKHMNVHMDLDKERKGRDENLDLLMKMDIREELQSKFEFHEI